MTQKDKYLAAFVGACLLIGLSLDFIIPMFGSRSFESSLEDFSQPITAKNGKTFGPHKAFKFILHKNGTFLIDGSGAAWQKSERYDDSAIIRSTYPLGKSYKVSVVVQDIEYDLQNVDSLPRSAGSDDYPGNENGAYFIAITDSPPKTDYPNTWWHKHRKLVIDVDNNVWGSGMPNPIFMVYFDKKNELMALNRMRQWTRKWDKGVQYEKNRAYRVEVERTPEEYILSVYSKDGTLLNQGKVPLDQVWHSEKRYPDYFVIGDPHNNYYQGSIKIDSVAIEHH